MKEIKAYIKPHKLYDVTQALQKVDGLTGMSVVNVRGLGRSKTEERIQRFTTDSLGYVSHVKIEIVCHDSLVEEVVSIIQDKAYTGLRGDGKIYISSVETAIRIETGERGEGAV